MSNEVMPFSTSGTVAGIGAVPISKSTQRFVAKELEGLRANALLAMANDAAQFQIAATRQSLQQQLDLVREDDRANLVDRKMLNAVIVEQKRELYGKLAPGAIPDLDRLRDAYIAGSVLDLLAR